MRWFTWHVLVWGLAALYVGGALGLSARAPSLPVLSDLGRYEAVHIVVHALMYGGLALVLRRAGSSAKRAAGITLAVAALQELAQVIAFRRWPGAPELFDLVVDSIAIGLALMAFARWERSRAEATESARADVTEVTG